MYDKDKFSGQNEWEGAKREYEYMINELMNDQSNLITKISALVKSGQSVEHEVEELHKMNISLENQRKLANEKLKFSEIVIKILQGKFHGGDCLKVHDRVDKEVNLLGGNFFIMIHHGSYGGENWGYNLIVQDKYYYCHEWVKDYCYVIAKVLKPKANISKDSLEKLVDEYYKNCKGDCIATASEIFDNLSKAGHKPSFAICKKSPGGYDHFCYNVTNSEVSVHKWYDVRGFLGIIACSYCVGVRI